MTGTERPRTMKRMGAITALAAGALALGVSVWQTSAFAQGANAPGAGAPSPEQGVPVARPGQTPGTFIGAESTVIGGAGVVKGTPSGAGAAAGTSQANDYPTVARADYVFACMQVNGQSRDVLEKCSCSIDVIASLLPFEKYEEAETIMSVRMRGGKATDLWNAPVSKEMIKDLKRAQIEGELRCF